MTKPNEPEGQKLRDLIAEVAADLSNENPFWTAKLLADALITRGIGIAPAQPVADAGGVMEDDVIGLINIVTDLAEVDALDKAYPEVWGRLDAMVNHAVAAATAAKDAEIAELAQAVRCIMARCEALEDEAYNGIANDRDKTHASGFWCGQKSTAKSIRAHLHDMTRAALSEAKADCDPLRDIVLRYIDRMNDVAPECGDPADRILGEFASEVNDVLKAERAALFSMLTEDGEK